MKIIAYIILIIIVASITTYFFSTNLSNDQTVFQRIQVKNTPEVIKIKKIIKDETILLKKVEQDNKWTKTQVFIDRDGEEEFVGEMPGNISEITSVYYGVKDSQRLNYRLSIIYKKVTGLHFFSADRFLDKPNIYFPYKLTEGNWIVTTTIQGGVFSEQNSEWPEFQIEKVEWHNAKLFTLYYKKPNREKLKQIEPRSFAEIDGMVMWLGPNRNEYRKDRYNLVDTNN
jgi:hypothetical protein